MHIHKPQLHHPLAQGREQEGLTQGIRACLAQGLSDGDKVVHFTRVCQNVQKGLEECLWSWQANACEA